MQLLVSVRSAAEVEPALAGGADIIDAKEPSAGSLGSVSGPTLSRIHARLPPGCPLSVALGDVANGDRLVLAIGSLPIPVRPGPVFVKLGFAGLESPAAVGRLLERAVAAAAHHPCTPRVVGVAYGDAGRARTLAPLEIARLAALSGAAGVLLDTHYKDGSGLFGWLTTAQVAAWVAQVRRSGLLPAVAGEIRFDDLETVLGLKPEIVGVRGAACEGGRTGPITADRVRALRVGLTRKSGLLV